MQSDKSIEDKRSRLNWKQIILTGFVTLIVCVIGGMLLFYLQMRGPELTYFVPETVPFQGPSENIAIYNVQVENNGKKEVENIVCYLTFPGCKIMESKVVTEVAIVYEEEILGNLYKVVFPSLNAKEGATISVLVSSPEEPPMRPEVSLRGKGISGKNRGLEGDKVDMSVMEYILFIVLGSVMIVAVGILLMTMIRDFMEDNRERSQEVVDQRSTLSYLCDIHGLKSDAERYLKETSCVLYSSEAERFAMLAVEDPNGEITEKRKEVLKELIEFEYPNESSIGILAYCVARIAKLQGKKEESAEYLEKAKKRYPKLVERRVELDPIWKEE